MLCEICKERQAEHKHHMFSNTKLNRKLYGKHIDRSENIMFVCSVCHLNKSIPKLTEKEFVDILGIGIRSKSGRYKHGKHKNFN